jgi:hypothetical protein
MEPWWQLSHAVVDGMCAADPAGLVGGITMIFVMPANPVTVGPWHSTQVVSVAWLMREPENLAPFGTGVLAMLELAPTWQTSQDCEVGTWLDGRPTIVKFTAGIAKDAAALPWHWAQLVVVLGAYWWIAANVGITEKSVPVWQFVQVAVVAVGM